MSSENESEAIVETPGPSGLGVWLREAREAQSLSATSIAEALRLDASIVEGLEAENFDALGATVFVKGHIRAIAGHLKLDADEAVERFHNSAGLAKDAEPELIVSYNKPIRKPGVTPAALFVGGMLVACLIGVALVYLWPLFGGESGTRAIAETTESSTEVPSATQATSDTIATADTRAPVQATSSPSATDALIAARAAAQDRQAAVTGPVEESLAPQVVAAQPDSPAPGQGLRLRFNDTCWFEVRDATGTRIAYGTASAGTDRLLNGVRPLRVILGVADVVDVTVDGEAYTISASERRGRSARLTIN
ncbi:MAG: RodZ domain-containing protein [Pseudomonadota bacterium]